MTTNVGFEQPRLAGSTAIARLRRAQANLSGAHSVLKELGIGTNDPEKALHILREATGCAVLLERIQNTANPSSVVGRKSRGTLSDRAAVVDGDDIFLIESQAYCGDTNEYVVSSRITMEVDGAVADSTNSVRGAILFKTGTGAATSPAEAIRVNSSQNVGIGDFSGVAPVGKLDVQGVIAISTEVSTPPQVAGTGKIYTKSDGKPYYISGDISETDLTADTDTTYSAGTLLDLSTTTFNVDLTEASEQTIANGDYILFLDGGATGTHAKENIADVASLFAGDGLTASSSVMAVNVDDSTIETSSDAIRVKDNGITLAKMAGLARGKIIVGDASGDPAALAAGNEDDVLTIDSNGDAVWEAGGGGGGGDITAVTIQTDSGSGSKASDTSGSADFIMQGDSAGIDVTNSGTTITVALDLNEISAGVVADGDSFVFVDANDGNANKKEAVADLATLFAGDGLTASSSVLAVNVDDSTIETNSDAIRIKDDGVTYAKIQNVSATDRILGRDSAGAGVIEEITPANLRTMINVADGATATTDTNTTYSISCVDGDNSDEEKIRLTAGGSGSGTDDVVLEAGTGLSIARSTDKITFTNTVSDTNTTYSAGTLLDLATTTFNVDLTEAAEAVLANGDYILFLDGGATGSHAKEAIADVATLFAGDGLTASSSVMAVNVDDSTIETNSDAIRIKDNGVTLAKMAGLARGSIIYGDASGDPAALSVGSNTYVLTSDGTDISWGSAGGGSARSVAGDTDNGVITWVTSDNTFASEANLTFDGNSLAVTTGSASAIPCTIKAASLQTADLLLIENSSSASLVTVQKDGTIKLGGSGTGRIFRENVSGTDVAGKILDLRGGKSTGSGIGGEVRIYTAPAGSSGTGVNNHAEALTIDGNKVVDFKIGVTDNSGSLYSVGTNVLKIQVGGTDYWLPLWEEAMGGGP